MWLDCVYFFGIYHTVVKKILYTMIKEDFIHNVHSHWTSLYCTDCLHPLYNWVHSSGYRLSVKPFSASPLHLLTSNNPLYGSTDLWRALLLPGRVQYATKRGRLCLHVCAPIHAVSIAVPADSRAVSHPRQIGKLCRLRLIRRVGE